MKTSIRGLPMAGIVVATALALGAAVAAMPREVTVEIATATGETLAFVPTEVRVRSTGRVIIEFHNVSAVEHNLTFTGGLAGSTRTIVGPGSTERLILEPPAPGSYRFVCTIHEGMAGVLVVEAATAG
jgi:plastocyanin